MTVAMHAAHDDRFSSVTRQMGKWMDQVLGANYRKYCPDEAWTPAVNLCESETHYCVVADLAGVKGGQIDVRTEGRRLTLAGYRQVPGITRDCSNVQIRHMEIDHGPFCRSLELPADADVDSVEATYKGGLLWIHIPKKK